MIPGASTTPPAASGSPIAQNTSLAACRSRRALLSSVSTYRESSGKTELMITTGNSATSS